VSGEKSGTVTRLMGTADGSCIGTTLPMSVLAVVPSSSGPDLRLPDGNFWLASMRTRAASPQIRASGVLLRKRQTMLIRQIDLEVSPGSRSSSMVTWPPDLPS
jgi:hypothetical protein